jgi:hypothetical protein
MVHFFNTTFYLFIRKEVARHAISPLPAFSVAMALARFHPYRTSGGDCHHCCPDWTFGASGSESTRSSQPYELCQQSKTDGNSHP